jgi:hypothetical protein
MFALTLQRRFCCVVGKKKASGNTYKTFRERLECTYKDGKPNEDEWMKIIDEDINSDFKAGPWNNRDLPCCILRECTIILYLQFKLVL